MIVLQEVHKKCVRDFAIDPPEIHKRFVRGPQAVADPGFPVGGGHGPRRGGRRLPRRLCFRNFLCQNERIRTLRGGCALGTPPRSANAKRLTRD